MTAKKTIKTVKDLTTETQDQARMINELQATLRTANYNLDQHAIKMAGQAADLKYYEDRLRDTTQAYNILADKICRARIVIANVFAECGNNNYGQSLGEIKGIFNLEYPDCPSDCYGWKNHGEHEGWHLERHITFNPDCASVNCDSSPPSNRVYPNSHFNWKNRE